MTGRDRRLGSARWPELPGRPLVVVPLGSVEQHGAHLPLGTDTTVACAVADAAVTALTTGPTAAPSTGWTTGPTTVLLAPALAYGASGEHEGFPGTISIGTEALTGLLVEYGRSAGLWAGRVLVVNGHGGNLDALRTAVPRLRAEGRDVAWFPCGVPGGDAHAGRTETSLLLHVEPDDVRPGLAAPGETAPIAELLPRLRAERVRGVSPGGVLGDPTGATAAEGAEQLAALIARLVDAAATWRVGAGGRLEG